jgi:hypothetical protein
MLDRYTGEAPHHPFYEYERELGNIIAKLHTIRQHAEVTMDHADNADLRYPEDSLNQIYIEMDEQLKTLEEFKAKLLGFQEAILKEIKGDSQEGGQILPFRKVS